MHFYKEVLTDQNETDFPVVDTCTVKSILCVIWEKKIHFLENELHHAIG